MFNHYPDQRPSFLFGRAPAEQEHIRYGTYLTLQADRDALEVQLKATEATLQVLMNELQAAGVERETLRMLAENKKNLSDQSKTSFLNVIGALVDLILGSTEAGRKHSIFESQASIVDSITSHHDGVKGLSKRSLDEKFAAGRRSLSQE
ncbi:protein kinase [Pseudomonas syringae pv. dysoxyli]|nr:protein kinase [Pseudomonas syringae pv. dysoxyli]